MAEPPVNRSYSELYPPFAEKIKDIVSEMNEWCEVHWPHHKCMLFEGFRTVARQQWLYASGRTRPGPIVTYKNGTTNKSNHQSRLAADIIGVTSNGQPTWDCPAGFWQYLGHLARRNGLNWGGDWHGFVDQPHVEWPPNDHATYQAASNHHP